MNISTPILTQLADGRSSVTCDLTVAGRKFAANYTSSIPIRNVGMEPLLSVSAIPAMRSGEDITVASPVSGKIVERFPRIVDTFTKWYSTYQPIELRAPLRGSEDQIDGRGVGCFFSGGVDSFYSSLRFEKEVDTLIFVHGFDVPLARTDLRAAISQNLRTAAAAMGKRLIEVETNVREFLDGFGNWGLHTHGSALISVAHLLSGHIRKIHIPSSGTRKGDIGWGSHPCLDHLWSSEALEVVHDDDTISRVDKTLAIAKSDIALANLRVCWENRNGAYNCGQCEKCLRTMMTLRLAGVLDRCKMFDRPIDFAAVADLRSVKSESRRGFYKEILQLALKTGDGEVARAVSAVLARKPKRDPWLARKFRGLRKRVLGR